MKLYLTYEQYAAVEREAAGKDVTEFVNSLFVPNGMAPWDEVIVFDNVWDDDE